MAKAKSLKKRVGSDKADNNIESLSKIVKDFPELPGVYRFLNRRDEVLYIGKAKNLRKRVSSYFRINTKHSPKTASLIKQTASIAYTEVDSELEAIILETNFIKDIKPRYNIIMRDDKSHTYLKIALDENFPRIYRLRNPKRDKSRIFGPFTSSDPLKVLDRVFRRIFPYRTCHLDIRQDANGKVTVKPKTRHLPCLLYHIKRCLGPCISACDKQEYRRMIDRIILFLEGKSELVAQEIKIKMRNAAEAREFETAARLRDQLTALEKLIAKQKIVSQGCQNQDIIGYAAGGTKATIMLFAVREGKLLRQNVFRFKSARELDGPEIMEAFLGQCYMSFREPAKVIVLAADINNKDAWSKILGNKKLVFPQRGGRHHLIKLANKNAQIALKKWQGDELILGDSGQTEILAGLSASLGIKSKLYRIECFDVSHIQGSEVVAAMAVLLNGKKAPAHYRRFKIRASDNKNDDCAALHEAITRRFHNMPSEKGGAGVKEDESFMTMPDLVVIDGGRGQINAAYNALKSLRLEKNVILCGLAKKEELIYMPKRKSQIQLGNSPARLLLQHLRDEAHRFAVTYHRQRRTKKMLRSGLDEIPGIGAAKRKLLLETLGSMDNVRRASISKLSRLVGKKLAKKIKEYA